MVIPSGHEGYVETTQARGLTPPVLRGDYPIDASWSGCATLSAKAPPPTAIFAANDITAIGVLNYLFRNGYRMPADISVVGYGDMPFWATAAIELTTVRQPVHQLAPQALFSLSESIAGKKTSATHSLVVPELIVRRSTSAK
nr:substrate-binding domain-containing protein [uncultured Shinella sp.]